MIQFDKVSKVFDGSSHPAVDQVDLTAQDGEILVILGSSGSGKSTLLKMANRLLERTSGEIYLDGKSITHLDPVSLRRKIGYVFQGIGLFPHFSVRENVSIVPKLLGASQSEQDRICHKQLELVNLPESEFGNRFPNELSGGQQQRVAVARALAADPDYLFMDEPFGALDAITRESLQQQLLHIAETVHKTILFVTHDIFEALALGDRIAVMHNGRLEQSGTKEELVRTPASDFVRELFEHPRKQIRATEKLFSLPTSSPDTTDETDRSDR